MAKLVSNTYGDALFELALESEKLDRFNEEVSVLRTALTENEELMAIMEHPKIAKDEKITLIEDIFKGRISDELVGLIRMIVMKDRFKEIDKVFEYFLNRVKDYKNIGTAYVTTALALTDEQKNAVESRLLDTTDYVKFEMHYSVDENLIGGMVIRIGDRVCDGSVKSRLMSLTKELQSVTV